MQKKSTLFRKLASYSGLVTAALLSSEAAQSQILYTDVDPDLTTNNPGMAQLDLNNDGINDFQFNLIHLPSSSMQIRVVGLSSNSITRDLINHPGSWQGYAYADTLPAGTFISINDVFFPQEIMASHYSFNDYGNWSDAFNQLMGLKVVKDGETFYGWARLSVPALCNNMTIHEYAIDTIAGEAVKAGDKCGNFAALVNTQITTPDPAGFCAGGSNELSTDSIGGYTYQWLQDGNPVNGAVTFYLDVNTAGDYAVVVTNAYGCIDTSATVNMQEFPIPDPPVITQSGDTLSTGAAITYQWYHNGDIIAGATSQQFVANQGGDYIVMIMDANGCTNISVPFTFIPVGVSGLQEVSVDIVESDRTVFIRLNDDRFLAGNIKIYKASGSEVYSARIDKKVGHLDLRTYASGIYLLMIENNSQRFAKKLILP